MLIAVENANMEHIPIYVGGDGNRKKPCQTDNNAYYTQQWYNFYIYLTKIIKIIIHLKKIKFFAKGICKN